MSELEMNMPCANARSLVASFLDGELSEEQSTRLRGHLLDCPECREAAKVEQTTKRWFREAVLETPEIPGGFAARVARRAFAGDPGMSAANEAQSGRGELLPFVLKLSAVAAATLFAFSILIQRQSLPASGEMDAQYRPPWEIEQPGAPAPDRGAADEDEEEPDDPDAETDEGR